MSSDQSQPAADVVDAPVGWVRDHIERYVATGGADGHIWNGYPTLLLTTTGRRTGLRRRTALIYGRSDDTADADYVIVASKGGAPEDPTWFGNIEADPQVEIQVMSDVMPATARIATGDERQRLWHRMTGIYADYDAYAERTDRQIPVVVLTPDQRLP